MPSFAQEPGSDPDVVEFRELELDEPATSFAMTEDGRQLVLTHQVPHFDTSFFAYVKPSCVVGTLTD